MPNTFLGWVVFLLEKYLPMFLQGTAYTLLIAIAGTGRGADTSVILRPSHAATILETRIKEIICKPGQ
jgi:hypothetical protein